METAVPKHLCTRKSCFWIMKSAPQALNRLLAWHSRKDDQTCELKARAQHKSPQTFACGPSDCVIICMCALDMRGACRLPSFSIDLTRRKHPSIRLTGKKLRLGQGELGLMQAAKRGFRGVGCAIRWDWSFWFAKISRKMSILKCAGREVELRRSDERQQNFSDKCIQRVFSTMFDMLVMHFLFERV